MNTNNNRDSHDTGIEEKLLDFFFGHAHNNYTFQEIIENLKLSQHDATSLKRILRRLVTRNELIRYKGRRYGAGHRTHIRSGKFEPGPFGAGFVRTESGDLYIPPGRTGTALPGDMVKAEVLARRTGRNPEARIIDILKRAQAEFIGTFHRENGFIYVIPESEFLKRHIVIPKNKTRSAENGQKVAVKITFWENEYDDPTGEIVDVLGYPGDKGMNILSVARAAGIPIRFSNKTVQAVDSLHKLQGEDLLKGRKDFREKKIFTIDPEEAKDFDDAISLEKLPDGNIELGVYIADVTAYVREGGPIDKAAKLRGTSTYLVDKVIHMLPEKLSTDYCSLVPDEERPVFAAIMTCAPTGAVLDYEFCEGVIINKHRFSYEDAQQVIDGAKKGPHRKTLLEMDRFAKILRKNRINNGSLDFFIPEVHFEFDKEGRPVSLSTKEIYDSNRLIEEFMLLANQTAVLYLKQLQNRHKMSLPFIYRVHDVPDQDDIRSFQELSRSLGCPAVRAQAGSSRWFQKILKYFSDKPEKMFIEDIALRSMMKAVYDSKNIGHFGLGFKNYTHFTSPIRRYPDLIVHRLLKRYGGEKLPGDLSGLKRRVTLTAKHASDMEVRAMGVERDAIKLKKLEYMQDKVGDEFNGIISGVTSFGIFVKLENILVEGLVHMRDLGGDYYIYDEAQYRLVGQHTNKTFKIGDKVTVQVIKINIDRGHLDLLLVTEKSGNNI
ncbi:ribonuclease R [candidate division KSB1 bacterium]